MKHLTSIIELGLEIFELNQYSNWFQQESSLSHLEPDIPSHFLLGRKTKLKLHEIYAHDNPFKTRKLWTSDFKRAFGFASLISKESFIEN